MYAKIENGAVAQYPYPLSELRKDVSLPADADDASYAEHGVYTVVATERPAADPITQVVQEADPIFDGGVWKQQWSVRDATPGEKVDQEARLLARFDAVLTAHLDAVAQSRRYQDRVTCALRAGYPGPFHNEGVAFATWMDSCNAIGYQKVVDYKAGLIPLPSEQELIAALPPMVWP